MVVPYPTVWSVILDSASSANDRMWPKNWPPLHLDQGLKVGSHGGNGPMRYSVSEYEPGRRIRFVPDADLGLDGYHEFTLTPSGHGQSLLTHTLDARVRGRMAVAWPLAIRPIHVAVLRDLLDNVEREATGTLKGAPARWSPWVRTLRGIFQRRAARLQR
jgi:hypothetical protein